MEIFTPFSAVVRTYKATIEGVEGVILELRMQDFTDPRRAEIFLSFDNIRDLVNDLESEYL